MSEPNVKKRLQSATRTHQTVHHAKQKSKSELKKKDQAMRSNRGNQLGEWIYHRSLVISSHTMSYIFCFVRPILLFIILLLLLFWISYIFIVYPPYSNYADATIIKQNNIIFINQYAKFKWINKCFCFIPASVYFMDIIIILR